LAEPLDRYDAELTTPDTVILELVAQDKIDAAAQLATKLHAAGRITNLEGFWSRYIPVSTSWLRDFPGESGCRTPAASTWTESPSQWA